MARPAIAVTMDTRQIKKIPARLKALERLVERSMKKPLNEFKDYWLKETDKTFASGGRGNVKWAPLKRSTRKRKRGRGILQESGRGRRSIRGRVVKNKGVELFTRVGYMSFHQSGTRRMAKRKFLFRTPKDDRRALRFFDKQLRENAAQFSRGNV